MILSFRLSMPNRGSWDGNWSGEGHKYIRTRSFRTKAEVAKAQKIVDKGSYHYSWPDGWGANVRVEIINSKESAKIRRKTDGFSGYDWMIDSIIEHGVIKA